MDKISPVIQIVKNKYEKRGFVIHTWHVDNEFDNDEVNKTIMPAKLIPYARNEHVGIAERSIRAIVPRL